MVVVGVVVVVVVGHRVVGGGGDSVEEVHEGFLFGFLRLDSVA
jgi:hypothetical protein